MRRLRPPASSTPGRVWLRFSAAQQRARPSKRTPCGFGLAARRLEFPNTPGHARWLKIAEIDIGVVHRQCIASVLTVPAITATGSTVR